jgi:hypothetical protein
MENPSSCIQVNMVGFTFKDGWVKLDSVINVKIKLEIV